MFWTPPKKVVLPPEDYKEGQGNASIGGAGRVAISKTPKEGSITNQELRDKIDEVERIIEELDKKSAVETTAGTKSAEEEPNKNNVVEIDGNGLVEDELDEDWHTKSTYGRIYPANGGYVRYTSAKRAPADKFVPHEFKTEKAQIENLPDPTILISPEAYSDIFLIVDESGSDEIGFLGTVNLLDNNVYLIDKIYEIPGQEVNSATTEMTEDGLGEIFNRLAQTDEGFEACGRMHFWGHVHPSTSTSPSTQDSDQMKLFKHNAWFIRGIFSRHGRAEFWFFDYKNNIVWSDVSWNIDYNVSEDRREYWRKQIKERLRPKTYQSAVTHVRSGAVNVAGVVVPPVKTVGKRRKKEKNIIPATHLPEDQSLAKFLGDVPESLLIEDREMDEFYGIDK